MSYNLSTALLELSGCDFDGIPMRSFDPFDHDLSADFRLTRFGDLNERTKKTPKDLNTKLMLASKSCLGLNAAAVEQEAVAEGPSQNLDSGLDITEHGSVVLKETALYGNLHLVQTTDFGYPIIDDPYLMGKIACANVLGDLYATGVVACDNMLMLVAVSTMMTEKERDTILPMIMRGFRECAMKAGANITGGQSVVNRWCAIGGVATSVCQEIEMIKPHNAVPGDVLLLTKPLGTHVALNVHKWMTAQNAKWQFVKGYCSDEDAARVHRMAVKSMCRLNRIAAQLMHKYGAHGATAIAEYGLRGHAENLVARQQRDVAFSIYNMPVIDKMATVAHSTGDPFHLLRGRAPEHSGGLLISMPREEAAEFCKEIIKLEGPNARAWIVGIVEKGEKTVNFVSPRILDVTI